MKKLLLVPMTILLVSTGCEKEFSGAAPMPPLPPPPIVDNTPPAVSAGGTIGVFMPVDSAFLSGSATDAENNIDRYRWRQIAGPSLAIIQTPDSPKTKISKLIEGEYGFELTVIDNGNLSGRDSVNVLVIDSTNPGNNIKIFNQLFAGCWGGECLLVMDGSSIPRNIPIKVFFKSEDSSVWMEAAYFFSSTDNYLRVQFGGGDLEESKSWEVMVMY